MTERGLPIVDGAPACPFVAFEDDRDERASSPDHRHRCYAEPRPAPRALAHQEAYCLSSAFPVCPTFQDWARREAARSRAEGARASEAAMAAADPTDQPQRNPRRNWAAPPPWTGGPAPGAGDGWEGASAGEDVPRRGRGLSGSFADRVAAGTAAGDGDGHDDAADAGDDDDSADAAALGAAGGVAIAAGAAAAEAAASAQAGGTGGGGMAPGIDAGSVGPRQRERDPGQVAAFEGSEESPGQPPGPRRERRRDGAAPEWERPRPQEVYPTLRSRRLPELSLPPLLVAVVAIALAAAVLFALPGLLGFGGPASNASPSASPIVSAAPQTFAPTPVPEPTQQVYVVQSGDTMSRIAKKFKVPLPDLIAANAENIPKPDELQIGDQVIIPAPQSSEVPAAS
jgi:hypothetical protein